FRPERQGLPSSQGLAAAFGLDINRRQTHLPGDFESDDNPPRRRPSHEVDLLPAIVTGDLRAQRAKHLWLLQDAELLEVDVAMSTAGEQEMAMQDSAG